MHLYSNSLSFFAIISSSFIIEFSPSSFCCSSNFNLPQSSLGLEDKHLVSVTFGFEEGFSLNDPAMIAGDLNKLMRDLSPLLF